MNVRHIRRVADAIEKGPGLNVRLIRGVADAIEAAPGLYDQGDYGIGDPRTCGAPCCIAGWALALIGEPHETGNPSIMYRAVAALGLPPACLVAELDATRLIKLGLITDADADVVPKHRNDAARVVLLLRRIANLAEWRALTADAAEAAETIDADELEAFAAERRRNNITPGTPPEGETT